VSKLEEAQKEFERLKLAAPAIQRAAELHIALQVLIQTIREALNRAEKILDK